MDYSRFQAMFRFFVTIVIVALIGFSCRKETLLEDNGATLEFSTDTIVFDTVFSTVGSATQLLTIYNPYNKTLRIKSITLARGPSSQFSINVNGTAGVSFKDIDIAAKDSLFVFARVTIDPGNMNNPFVVTDSIIFETNGQLQDVDLVAWGQDAYYHTPDHFFPNFPPYSIIDCALPWTNDKPHVVYGWAVVDSGTVLTMNPGTRVYMHNESVLWVYSDGSLKINGTNDDQVIIQGDRLEHYYDDVPGQWGRIWLSAGSKDNVIDHAHIKNGTIGLLVDTLGASASPTLTIRNSIVENMSFAGLYAQGSVVLADNCVFANCAQYCVALALGGWYEFTHCTIANYWKYQNRTTPALILNNYYEDVNGAIQVRTLEKAWFGNCIIFGSNETEIGFDQFPAGTFSYLFDNSLIQIDPEINTSDANFYNNIIKNPTAFIIEDVLHDPVFNDQSKYDFRLFADSKARNAGNMSIATPLPDDLEGNSRLQDGQPDLGAYEFQPD